MRVETIESIDDPRVEDFRATRDPDAVKKRGIFIAESPFVVQTLIERSRFPVRSVFIGTSRVEVLRPVLEQLPEGVPVYVAEQSVMNQIVGFRIHRSCLASGDVLPPADPTSVLQSKPRLVVGLEAVSNHDNTGGIFRNASAFGAGAVLLDHDSADPLYRKAIRVSVASTLTVPFARCATAAAAMEELKAMGYESWALTPQSPSEDIESALDTLGPDSRVALWLGAEGPGLSDAALGAADRRVRIAMSPGPDAINVAASSAVALYLVSRRLRALC